MTTPKQTETPKPSAPVEDNNDETGGSSGNDGEGSGNFGETGGSEGSEGGDGKSDNGNPPIPGMPED